MATKMDKRRVKVYEILKPFYEAILEEHYDDVSPDSRNKVLGIIRNRVCAWLHKKYKFEYFQLIHYVVLRKADIKDIEDIIENGELDYSEIRKWDDMTGAVSTLSARDKGSSENAGFIFRVPSEGAFLRIESLFDLPNSRVVSYVPQSHASVFDCFVNKETTVKAVRKMFMPDEDIEIIPISVKPKEKCLYTKPFAEDAW